MVFPIRQMFFRIVQRIFPEDKISREIFIRSLHVFSKLKDINFKLMMPMMTSSSNVCFRLQKYDHKKNLSKYIERFLYDLILDYKPNCFEKRSGYTPNITNDAIITTATIL